MSSAEEKKNSKNRAKAVAAWEWFKEAAWLQVLLIVGLVVGLVIAIPFIVQAIVAAIDDTDSDFYETHEIKYADLLNYRDGNTKNVGGYIGDGTTTYSISDSREGFVVMYYKDNCDNCKTMQTRVETWYDEYNKTYGDGNLKFYTINVGWDPGDEDDCNTYEGQRNRYDNDNITLAEQFQVQQDVKPVYLKYDKEDPHRNSSVDENKLDTQLDTPNNSGTMPTPCFVTYAKDKTEKSYEMEKVIFGAIGSLSLSSETDVSKEMLDIFLFQEYTEAK